ncbi:uncharacterized protein PHACADRAFT_199110 [Phanerochaete carnosa HHB-10118-sp]|uniref:Uncharacterized protein n=1 Tax=Phanerochaete carnosa (strain HHB-10118-sp) TaxID=650164 RepID=K5UPA3_PHACS|nr:uncharacterized protein PHACADRAFT_199110 [Phanerochaete carnosa HHB-10118-sp]EKM51601.1 hypothetical protein PHACADRAFT_199110 [Phanerochaete carnosa HHB-10118-sp]
MSSALPPGAHVTSDRPWIIVSALIFGPTAAYLLSPPAAQKAHEAKDAALPKHKIPDPARAPVPAGEDTESTPRKPETDQAVEGIADDEGNKTPASEVAEATNKVREEDAPKVAQYAGAETSKRADPETHDAAKTTDYDPNVAQHADTEHKEDSSALETSHKGPRDVGDARERSKAGMDPNTSSQVDEQAGEEDKKDAKQQSDEGKAPSSEKKSAE